MWCSIAFMKQRSQQTSYAVDTPVLLIIDNSRQNIKAANYASKVTVVILQVVEKNII